jgi:hypothetical protein
VRQGAPCRQPIKGAGRSRPSFDSRRQPIALSTLKRVAKNTQRAAGVQWRCESRGSPIKGLRRPESLGDLPSSSAELTWRTQEGRFTLLGTDRVALAAHLGRSTPLGAVVASLARGEPRPRRIQGPVLPRHARRGVARPTGLPRHPLPHGLVQQHSRRNRDIKALHRPQLRQPDHPVARLPCEVP